MNWFRRINATQGGYEWLHAGMLGGIVGVVAIFAVWFLVGGFLVTSN